MNIHKLFPVLIKNRVYHHHYYTCDYSIKIQDVQHSRNIYTLYHKFILYHIDTYLHLCIYLYYNLVNIIAYQINRTKIVIFHDKKSMDKSRLFLIDKIYSIPPLIITILSSMKSMQLLIPLTCPRITDQNTD